MRYLLLISFCLCFGAGALYAQSTNWRGEWPRTDFAKTSVVLSEIRSGGVSRDGIPAIRKAKFRKVSKERRIDDREPVMVVESDGQVPRAYPVRYLMWHEIVNDTVGSLPIAVTFCPLCNSGLTFDRRAKGKVLNFGVTGKLRHSDMVMFDRETESWWQQFTGQAIVGALTGTRLKKIPSWTESWGSFRARNPDGLVMRQPKISRPYGRNPYDMYDSRSRPFLYDGENPPHGIEPLARVVNVGARAWPLARLAQHGEIIEAGIRLSWQAGMASALDSTRIGKGRDVGAIRVRDAKTGQDVPHDIAFAFCVSCLLSGGDVDVGTVVISI